MGRGWFQRPPTPTGFMISLLLLAGDLLVLVVVTLAWLEPGEFLRPSRRSQLIAGLVGGGVSALVLLSLRSGPDGMAVVVHSHNYDLFERLQRSFDEA